MKFGRGSTRLRFGLVTGVALLAFAGLFAAGASAQTPTPPSDWSGLPANQGPWDPFDTNVPYLAWRGENVRLVKCIPDDPVSTPGEPIDTATGFTYNPSHNPGSGLDITMTLFDYSTQTPTGQLLAPQPVQQSASVFYDYNNDRICARQTWISAKPGIAEIKLSVSYDGILLGQHDFLVGWMSINTPHITNAGSPPGEFPGTVPGNSVNVLVTGSMPTGEFASDYGLPGTLTMPNDWATWADAMASVEVGLGKYYGYPSNPLWSTPASAFWDIHDSSGPLASVTDSPDVHVNQLACPNSTPDPFVDQVDNCTGAGDEDLYPFSRVQGDFGTGVGPFDPAFAVTLLSDGRLNANDAPMPAAKIVFNSSGGMGGFVNSCYNDKDTVYNRNVDFTKFRAGGDSDESFADDCFDPTATSDPESAAHALYAPYYEQYIPATSRGYGDPYDASSGVDGPLADPNNFTGFDWYGLYQNWEIADTLVQGQGGDTGCLLTGDTDRSANTGATRVVEFTDEHGEARADWQPGVNADFFANFANNNGEGGCDLAGVVFPHQVITASARYPYQPVASDVPAPESITKTVLNGFNKTLSCVAKKSASGTVVGYICTVTAIDITNDGSVFNGEEVCLQREPVGAWFSVGGSALPQGDCGPLAQAVYLSGGGPGVPASASAETLATLTGTNLDISANFLGEKIIRDLCFTVGSAGGSTSDASPCVAGGGSTSTTGTGTTGTTGTTGSTGTTGTTGTDTTTGTTGPAGGGSTTGGVTVHKVKHIHKAARLAGVQFRTTAHGRVLYVKVLSPKHSAKIRILLMNGKHHVVLRAVRTIKTNHSVKVAHLRISSQVKAARVVVLH